MSNYWCEDDSRQLLINGQLQFTVGMCGSKLIRSLRWVKISLCGSHSFPSLNSSAFQLNTDPFNSKKESALRQTIDTLSK